VARLALWSLCVRLVMGKSVFQGNTGPFALAGPAQSRKLDGDPGWKVWRGD